MVHQVFLNGRDALLAHRHQTCVLAFQLFLRLDKISSVCPHAGKSLGDHHGPRGTCESGQECAAFEIILHILRIVEIGRRNIVRVHISHFHQGPEFPQTFICHFFTSISRKSYRAHLCGP